MQKNQSTLIDIITEDKIYVAKSIFKLPDIDKYVIELIRISDMYKFELRIKSKIKQQSTEKNTVNPQENIEEQINKKETEEDSKEIRQYISLKEFSFENIKIDYGKDTIKVKDSEYYKVEKPKFKIQELREKEGFYQITTTQAKVRVQIWPKHLPYDHLKERRAFLFC